MTPLANNFSFGRKALGRKTLSAAVAAFAAVVFANATPVRAQSPAVALPPQVEMASVRPSASGSRMTAVSMADAGTLNMKNAPTKSLIEFAYDLQDSQLAGGPEWIDSEKYDVEWRQEVLPASAAQKPNGDPQLNADPQQQRRAMARSVLDRRFNLRLIRQTRQTPVYALVVAGDSPKIPQKPAAPDAVVSLSVLVEEGKLTMTGGSNDELAKLLAGQLGCDVVDKTGLNGTYDVTLQWRPDNPASLIAAVQERVGLKLEEHIVPAVTYVIDEVEKPSQDSAQNY